MNTFQSRWWQLAAIQIGGAICLPIFVVGHAMAEKYGFLSALLSVAVGNGILLSLGLVAAHYAVKTRMTTADAAADAFGERGKLCFALILTLSMMGWFSIQLNLMGVMAGSILGLDSSLSNLILGAVITLVGLHGIRGMEWLAKVCMPLLLMTIGYAVFNASTYPEKEWLEEAVSLNGVSIAIAAAIGAVVDMPTFFRNAKNSRDALMATFVLFALALPLLESVGIYLAKQGAGENLADALIDEHSSPLWKGWVTFFIILAGWTTNNTNLYSASMSLKSALHLSSERWCHVILGIGATFFSLYAGEGNLTEFLEFAGVMLASAGGVMIVHQISKGQTSKPCNVIAMIAGVGAGVLEIINFFQISGFGMVDAFGCSFLLSAQGGGWMAYKNHNKENKIYEIC